jgi:predicted extracellular nuclease
VEAVAANDFTGLDEIHVQLPSTLTGAGTTALVVDADGVQSNVVSVRIGGVIADKVVITQIYGGGGNSGAPFRNDFIEIFNSGSNPVSLAGWSVQYASATASTWSTTPLTAVNLSPGQRYLIQQAGGNNGAALPTPDATGTIAMAAGAGKVALVRSTTALTTACPSDPNIVDFAGYGSTANCFRGTAPAPGASNTNAATRMGNGCTDTRNNASDFTLAPPNPRNTGATFNQCTITESVVTSFPDALAQRRNHNSATALRLRRFP